MRLTGKIALVTGAASGIGKAITLKFAQLGAHLVISDIDEPALGHLEAALSGGTNHVLAVGCNVASEEAVQAMIARVEDRFGRLDILVNNAGVLGPIDTSITHLDVDVYQSVMDVNLLGPLLCTKYGIPLMLRNSAGVIVNIASTAGLYGITGSTPYCVSKAGLIQLTRVTALECAEDNIRVCAICPGNVDTPLLRRQVMQVLRQTGVENPEAVVGSAHAIKRLCQPEEVAAVAAFLVSEEASFVTGSTVLVDGGQMAGR